MTASSTRYYRVGPAIWHEKWTDDARLVAVYLLTSPHRCTEGLYRLPASYGAEDMGWTVRRFTKALHELVSAEFVAYDDVAQVVFLRKALKWQAPHNPNQITAALKALEQLPPTGLRDEFVRVARTLAPRLYARVSETHPEWLPHPPSPAPTPEAKASSSEPSGFDEQIIGLCHLLADLIRKRDPKAKVAPDSRGWLTDMDRLVRLDDRTPAEVRRIIEWCQADSFWQANILSPGKLREKFTALALKANTVPSANGHDADAEAAKWAARGAEWAQEDAVA